MKKRSTVYVLYAGIILCALSCNYQSDKPRTSVIQPKDSNIINVPAANPYRSADPSPMDMSYFPDDYAKLKMANAAADFPVMRIIYSRPRKSGRHIFGGLLKYNQPWRLGANEASEIEFFTDVTIQTKKIRAGRYIIYCIPEEKQWVIVLNTNLYSWGLQFDTAKDIERFIIPVETTDSVIEYFTMVFEKTGSGANLVMTWDNVLARLPVNFR